MLYFVFSPARHSSGQGLEAPEKLQERTPINNAITLQEKNFFILEQDLIAASAQAPSKALIQAFRI